MGMTVLIPYLVGRTVDEIEHAGSVRPDLWPLALAIVGAGLLAAAIVALRPVPVAKPELASAR